LNFSVTNKEISVGQIDIIGVASASVFLVGDTETITCSSAFDTPAESLIVGPFQPLPPETGT
jgi:spore germination protein PD